MIAEPVARRNVYELVADQLRRQISSGKLKTGDSLPTERALTQAYRVGRSSVREALRLLESQGLVEVVGHGAFVVAGDQQLLNRSLRLLLTLDKVNLQELYEVRKTLEVAAAALAATRRTSDQLVDMEQAITDMVTGLDFPERFSEADVRFHLCIVTATGNRVILHMMSGIRDLLQRSLASVSHIPGVPARAITHHRAILEAVSAGRPESARAAMLDHLTQVENDIRGILTAPRSVPPE
jgi:GntR family transcriptional repressor for pyruvate dehydrogenase complex